MPKVKTGIAKKLTDRVSKGFKKNTGITSLKPKSKPKVKKIAMKKVGRG